MMLSVSLLSIYAKAAALDTGSDLDLDLNPNSLLPSTTTTVDSHANFRPFNIHLILMESSCGFWSQCKL